MEKVLFRMHRQSCRTRRPSKSSIAKLNSWLAASPSAVRVLVVYAIICSDSVDDELLPVDLASDDVRIFKFRLLHNHVGAGAERAFAFPLGGSQSGLGSTNLAGVR